MVAYSAACCFRLLASCPIMSESYQLYQYDGCPFCSRVQRFLDGAGIQMEIRDTLRDPQAFRELLQGGGSSTVPCLKIVTEDATRWLYESLEIIEYLKQRTGS